MKCDKDQHLMDDQSSIASADLLYGVPAIAEFLNVRPRQAHHMIDTGGLPAFKIAGKICARRSTVLTWLAQREAAAAPVNSPTPTRAEQEPAPLESDEVPDAPDANDRDILRGAASIGDFLEIGERDIRRMYDKGQLPGWKIGRVLLARRSTLIAWTERQRAQRRRRSG